jgi:hypothetical protein
MGMSDALLVWLFLRFIAGVASAFVLVGASAWSLAHLASWRRTDLGGFVFAGVGTGIALAGALALVSAVLGGNPAHAWVALGAVALAIALGTWRAFAVPGPAGRENVPAVARLDRSSWLLVACYGAFGFGYIVPATFIPAMARALVPDPLVFGWAWPVFGVAAAVSTVLVTTLFRSAAPRRVAAASLLVMAVGVAAPAIDDSLGALLVSALCVGGTFMVTTMASVQEARRVSAGDPTKLIAALTAAFALGQLAGPVFASTSHSVTNGFILASSLAAALLAASAVALLCVRERAPPRTDPLPHQRSR